MDSMSRTLGHHAERDPVPAAAWCGLFKGPEHRTTPGVLLRATAWRGPGATARPRRRLPPQMEAEILEDPPAGQEGAAETRQDLPAAQVAHAARVGHFGGLLDELAVELVPQRAQVVPCLQDALDYGDGVRHGLQLLQGIEDLDGFVL